MAFPLLIIPLAIYNMIAFLTFPNLGWAAPILPTPVRLVSGSNWTITFSDALIALALLLLCVEIIKAARPGTKTAIDHLLSTAIFVGAMTEFVMVAKAANSTFAILCVICFVDMIAGIAISIRVSRRGGTADRVEAPPRQPPASHPVAEAPHQVAEAPRPDPPFHVLPPATDLTHHVPDAPRSNP